MVALTGRGEGALLARQVSRFLVWNKNFIPLYSYTFFFSCLGLLHPRVALIGRGEDVLLARQVSRFFLVWNKILSRYLYIISFLV